MDKFEADTESEDITEFIWNNLPAWDSSFLPWDKSSNDDIGMNYILNRHTLEGRFEHLINTNIFVESKFGQKAYKNAGNNLLSKIKSGAKLTKVEEDIIQYLVSHDSKDHFPRSMSNKQIFAAITESYKNCFKVSEKQVSMRDCANTDRFIDFDVFDFMLYQGKAKDGMIIRFWFDFTKHQIKTAYPYDTDRVERERKEREYNEYMEKHVDPNW
jgi:hypothetical protein